MKNTLLLFTCFLVWNYSFSQQYFNGYEDDWVKLSENIVLNRIKGKVEDFIPYRPVKKIDSNTLTDYFEVMINNPGNLKIVGYEFGYYSTSKTTLTTPLRGEGYYRTIQQVFCKSQSWEISYIYKL